MVEAGGMSDLMHCLDQYSPLEDSLIGGFIVEFWSEACESYHPTTSPYDRLAEDKAQSRCEEVLIDDTKGLECDRSDDLFPPLGQEVQDRSGMILLPIGVKPLGLESEPLPYLGRGIEPRLESWADPFYDRRFYLPDRNELDPFDRGFRSTEDHGEGDQRSGHSSRWCRGAHSYQDSPS